MARNSSGIVRRLAREDVPQALQLSSEAGWNQTQADWQTMLDVEPEGCFAVDGDDGLAATATLVRYGERLGWLGMVLTSAKYRRQGFARSLVVTALDYADECGVQAVKLDATDQGQPLYESVGFQAEASVERWSRVFVFGTCWRETRAQLRWQRIWSFGKNVRSFGCHADGHSLTGRK
jgi:GNAT superfamily N-acetyltransferase